MRVCNVTCAREPPSDDEDVTVAVVPPRRVAFADEVEIIPIVADPFQ